MVIQTEDMRRNGWRIAGTDMDWQIQRQTKSGKRKGDWYATNYYSSLEFAMEKAYEMTLRDSKAFASEFLDALEECRRVKRELVSEVRASA